MSVHLYTYVGPYLRVEVPQNTYPYDLLGDSEALSPQQSDESGDTHYYLPNVRRDGYPIRVMTMDRNGESEALEDIHLQAPQEIEWFSTAYAPEIAMITEQVPTARVGYGVVPYWY